jgi:hypothetical protein
MGRLTQIVVIEADIAVRRMGQDHKVRLADEIYAQQPNMLASILALPCDAPESASFQSGITTRGLASRFGWDSQVADCVRNQGSSESGETGASSAPGPATGAAPAGGPPR